MCVCVCVSKIGISVTSTMNQDTTFLLSHARSFAACSVLSASHGREAVNAGPFGEGRFFLLDELSVAAANFDGNTVHRLTCK